MIKPQNQWIYLKNACCIQLNLVLGERVIYNCTEISHLRESKTVLDSGFHAVDSVSLSTGFQSLPVELGFWIPSAVFRTSKPRIRDSTSKIFRFWIPLACMAGVRKGRGRKLGRETTLSRAPKFPFPLSTPATQARIPPAKIFWIPYMGQEIPCEKWFFSCMMAFTV